MAEITLTDILALGLGVAPMPKPAEPIRGGAYCAITGQFISAGYRIRDLVGDATGEFLDTFHNNIDGYVSESVARCFKDRITHQSFLVFADGTAYRPLIARESAHAQGRPCWSALVRQIWPSRRGQKCIVLLTTDTKKRLWPRCRIGALGENTQVFIHDMGQSMSANYPIDWPIMLRILGLVEEIYAAGFSKQHIRTGLYAATKAIEAVGYRQAFHWEQALYGLRPLPEFSMAVLIAQKKEEHDENHTPEQVV